MKVVRNKADIIEVMQLMKDIDLPTNAAVTITMETLHFDDVIVRGIGKAVDMDTIHIMEDDTLFVITREREDMVERLDSGRPQLVL